MSITVGYIREMLPDPRHRQRQIPVAERCTIAKSAWLALESGHIMPRVEEGIPPTKAPFMLADNLAILSQDDPRGVGLKLDGAANSAGFNAVLVSLKIGELYI